jgi:hypothetical protein
MDISTFAAPIAALLGVGAGHWLSSRSNRKQWARDQKLKIYSDVLRAINEYSVWLADLSDWSKFGSQAGRKSESTLTKEIKQIAGEFHAAYGVAPLFVSDASIKLLEAAKPTLFYHSAPFSGSRPDDMDEYFDKLKRVREDLIIAAKSDLAKD